MRDGAHSHEVDNDAPRTDGDGKHAHGVEFGFSGGVVSTAEDGEHTHLLLVRSTARDGIHTHDMTIGGVTMRSLLPVDIVKLLNLATPPTLIEIERALARITVSKNVVLLDGVRVCLHKDHANASVCSAARKMLFGIGLTKPVFNKNFHGLDWLMRPAAEKIIKGVSGRRLGDGLLEAMSKLINE